MFVAPDLIGIWKCWFLRSRENRSTRRKTSRSKDENQQQIRQLYAYAANESILDFAVHTLESRCYFVYDICPVVTYTDLRKILFIKINERNKLFTNYNNHDKVCFLFNNTDSYISRLTATFSFQAFERRKKHNKFNYTIQLYLNFLFHYSSL